MRYIGFAHGGQNSGLLNSREEVRVWANKMFLAGNKIAPVFLAYVIGEFKLVQQPVVEFIPDKPEFKWQVAEDEDLCAAKAPSQNGASDVLTR